MEDFDKAQVKEILDGGGDWFSALLLRLIEKADATNREKLRLGFPEEVEAVENFLYGKIHTAKIVSRETTALSRSEQHALFVKTLTGDKDVTQSSEIRKLNKKDRQ